MAYENFGTLGLDFRISQDEYQKVLERNALILGDARPYEGPGLGATFENILVRYVYDPGGTGSNGLCVQTAIIATRLHWNPATHTEIEESDFQYGRAMFKYLASEGLPTPSFSFIRRNKHIFQYNKERLQVTGQGESLIDIHKRLSINDRLLISFTLEFPFFKHPNKHWLAVLDYDEKDNRFLLAGDLSPFGFDTYMVTVDATAIQPHVEASLPYPQNGLTTKLVGAKMFPPANAVVIEFFEREKTYKPHMAPFHPPSLSNIERAYT